MSTGHWLVAARFDLGLLIGPALLAALIALILPAGVEVGPLGFLVLVVGIDVAHVWATLWRTLFDPGERRRLAPWLVALPFACAVVAMMLHGVSPPLFWTAMAYLAVFHFIRQQLGFGMLYRARAGLGHAGAAVERWLYYGLTGTPILWWHAHLPRPFAWFMPGDFVPGLPAVVPQLAGVVTLGLGLLHLKNRLAEGASWGRDLWLVTTAAVWWGGVVFARGDLAFTLPNVVHHGVPYLALVAWTVAGRWAVSGEGPGRPWMFTAAGAWAFVLPLLLLALGEEWLWDRLVNLDYPGLFPGPDLTAWAGFWATPLLSVPQLTHYLLDGILWRTGGEHNPGLRQWILR